MDTAPHQVVDQWADLERKALAASQGHWHLDDELSTGGRWRGWIFCDGNYIATTHRGAERMIDANASYIAACEPALILRLIAEARSRYGTWTVIDKTKSPGADGQ